MVCRPERERHATLSRALARFERPDCANPEYSESRSVKHVDLGEPLDIGQIAALTGCSPWTVRLDAHAERASPFRFSASGRLTFYKNQVTSWIVSGSKKVVDSILERLWSLRDLAEATPTAWPLLLVRSSRKFP